jgi:hypothetical protein
VPAETPVITPPVDVIVATVLVLVVQAPPVRASVSVIVEPTHTVDGPDMAGAPDVTVMLFVTMHPPT